MQALVAVIYTYGASYVPCMLSAICKNFLSFKSATWLFKVLYSSSGLVEEAEDYILASSLNFLRQLSSDRGAWTTYLSKDEFVPIV